MSRRSFALIPAMVVTLAAACGGPAPSPAATPAVAPRSPGTLYHRLGGYDALAAVVDDFEATGGPCVYVGKDMKTAHTGLDIREDDWTRGVRHLVATLEAFGVPARDREELLSAVAGLKDQIVGQ